MKSKEFGLAEKLKGMAVEDIGESFIDVFGIAPTSYYHIADALYSENGANLSAVDVAKVYRYIGCGPSEIADYLSIGTSLSHEEIARVFYGEDGFDMSAEEVAEILCWYHGLRLSAEEVAKLLYKKNGLNLSAEEVVKVLKVLYERLKEDLPAREVTEVVELIKTWRKNK
jgi:hypothetical protein